METQDQQSEVRVHLHNKKIAWKIFIKYLGWSSTKESPGANKFKTSDLKPTQTLLRQLQRVHNYKIIPIPCLHTIKTILIGLKLSSIIQAASILACTLHYLVVNDSKTFFFSFDKFPPRPSDRYLISHNEVQNTFRPSNLMLCTEIGLSLVAYERFYHSVPEKPTSIFSLCSCFLSQSCPFVLMTTTFCQNCNSLHYMYTLCRWWLQSSCTQHDVIVFHHFCSTNPEH